MKDGEAPVQRQLELDEETIDYSLRRTSRRTLGITVEPDGSVVVTAPADADLAHVESILRRRRNWIRRRLSDVAARPPAPREREWVSGETHRYLGRQYRLRVRRGDPAVHLVGAFFRVTVQEPPDTARVQKLMERWYLDHARRTFDRRLTDLVRSTPLLRLAEAPPLLVRKLRKRWGSCSPEGRILVNVEAVKLPVGCIDYLLVHELCHLRVPHHGREFWRLLDRCMPDWEQWRLRLERAET